MIDWFVTNWASVVAIVAGILSVASIVVKLTPTTKDDEFVAKVTEVFNTLSAKK